MGHPLISVIIPAYNAERFLAETLESVLAQDYAPFEVIVVNDGSTDRTAAVAAGFGGRVRAVYQPNGGLAAARNLGLRAARGELIGFCDADDCWTADKLRIQSALLREHPEVEVVVGHLRFTRPGRVLGGRVQFVPFDGPQAATSFGTSLFRRSAFEKVGPPDEATAGADDIDWFLRAREAGVSILFHREVVYFYRRHENNMSNRVGENFSEILKTLKQSLDRRRAANGGGAAALPELRGLAGQRADDAARPGEATGGR
jgi:glycosyltransferase involved in cell wall biosynthesis